MKGFYLSVVWTLLFLSACSLPCKGNFGFLGKAFQQCKEENKLLLFGLVAVSSNQNPRPTCPITVRVRESVPQIQGTEIELSGSNCTNAKLQEAINTASKIKLFCDEITISNQLVVPIEKKVHIIGKRTSGGKTVLNGGGTKRILFSRSSSITILESLEFKNGKSEATIIGTNPPEKNAGGAIFNGYKAELYVLDSHFYNNSGGIIADGNEEGGGAIYTKSFGKVTIINSYFEGNTGGLGGAINSLLSKLTIIDSTFVNNNTTVGDKTGYGGAIYTDGAGLGGVNGALNRTDLNPPSGLGEIKICSSVFKNNKGKGQGGGAFVYAYPPDTITIDKSIFIANTLEKDFKNDSLGGGLRTGNGDTTVTNSLFMENISRGQGGGWWKGEKGNGISENNLFWENFTYDGTATLTVARNRNIAGGIGGAVTGDRIQFQKTTMINNHAGGVVGAVWGEGNSLQNSLIAFNTAYNDGNNYKQGNNCFGPKRPNDSGGNLEFPNKFAGNSSANNVTCVNEKILDPLYESIETFHFSNSPITPVPRAKLEFCSLEVGADGFKEKFRYIPLKSGSPAVGIGYDCPK
ncbi:MAG: hypothetical protein N3A69_01910 [Leptospiraceae bacterium]|nr:hypothetical protein [Leptospiraceae bacterium]